MTRPADAEIAALLREMRNALDRLTCPYCALHQVDTLMDRARAVADQLQPQEQP
jgi:hypothetical protein